MNENFEFMSNKIINKKINVKVEVKDEVIDEDMDTSAEAGQEMNDTHSGQEVDSDEGSVIEQDTSQDIVSSSSVSDNNKSIKCGEKDQIKSTNKTKTYSRMTVNEGQVNVTDGKSALGPTILKVPDNEQIVNSGSASLDGKRLIVVNNTNNSVQNSAQMLIKVFKCSVNDCKNIYIDQTLFEQHMQTDHRVAINIRPNELPPMTSPIAVVSQQKTMTPNIVNTNQTQQILVPVHLSQNMSHSTIPGHCNSSTNIQSNERNYSTLIAQNSSTNRDQPSGTHPIEHVFSNKKTIPDTKQVKRPDKAMKASVIRRGVAIDLQLQEAVINLKEYFQTRHPEWGMTTFAEEISAALKMCQSSVYKIFAYYKKHGKLRASKRPRVKQAKTTLSDEDRSIVERCIDKLKNESRLNSVMDVWNEINTSDEFNVSFKGRLGRTTFYRMFKESGFRITETMIVNQKPGHSTSQVSKKCSVDGQWPCEWPECGKTFAQSQHYIVHMRTHTREKPYACRQPGCDYKCAASSNFNKHLKVHDISVTRKMSIEKPDE